MTDKLPAAAGTGNDKVISSEVKILDTKCATTRNPEVITSTKTGAKEVVQNRVANGRGAKENKCHTQDKQTVTWKGLEKNVSSEVQCVDTKSATRKEIKITTSSTKPCLEGLLSTKAKKSEYLYVLSFFITIF